MSLLQEFIVYIWLIPVLSQIVLPLGILFFRAMKKLFSMQFKKSSSSQTITISGQEFSVNTA